MKKLCFSSYFKILSQSKIKINDEVLFDLVVGPFFKYGYRIDKGDISRYKNGTIDLPSSYSVGASKQNVDDLSRIYIDGLEKNISPTSKANVVLAIKDLLYSESSLPDSTIIGDNKYYTKHSIINNTTFSFSDLLANVTIYCMKIPNINTPEIDSSYVATFDSKRNEVYLSDKPLKIDTALSFTARNELFDNTFTEIKHTGKIFTPNPSMIKIYALRFINKEFSFSDINSFILKNIGRYVFSRAKRNDYTVKGDDEILGIEAINELKRANPSLSLGDHFSEIMLYSFLECSLNAPKIFSKFELDKLSGTFNSSSSGVHLLVSNDIKLKNHQLAFGASHIQNNLNIAVDNAFNQIIEISKNINSEISLVETNIFDNTFDEHTTMFLKDTILPKKTTTPKPDTSFGVFLGYSISLTGTDDMDNIEFRDEVNSRMEIDILSAIPYIQNKISVLGLTSYSFYFYVLPLIDAENDKQAIMSSSIGGVI